MEINNHPKRILLALLGPQHDHGLQMLDQRNAQLLGSQLPTVGTTPRALEMY